MGLGFDYMLVLPLNLGALSNILGCLSSRKPLQSVLETYKLNAFLGFGTYMCPSKFTLPMQLTFQSLLPDWTQMGFRSIQIQTHHVALNLFSEQDIYM